MTKPSDAVMSNTTNAQCIFQRETDTVKFGEVTVSDSNNVTSGTPSEYKNNPTIMDIPRIPMPSCLRAGAFIPAKNFEVPACQNQGFRQTGVGYFGRDGALRRPRRKVAAQWMRTLARLIKSGWFRPLNAGGAIAAQWPYPKSKIAHYRQTGEPTHS